MAEETQDEVELEDNETQDESTGESESEETSEGEESESENGSRTRAETQIDRLKREKRELQEKLKGYESNKEGRKEANTEEIEERYLRQDLRIEGIKGKKEQDVVLQYIAEKKLLGKEIDVETALKSTAVKEELAELRAKSTIPAPSTRTGKADTDSFEYWKKQALKGNFPRGDREMMKRLEKARIFTTK